MKGKKWLILVASLGIILLANSVGITAGSFVDPENSSDNNFQAWASTLWTQTTQADFNAGVLNNVDTSLSPGNVKLALRSGWYDVNWQYRRAITIDHTKVQDVANPSTTYANFPVLVYATGLSNIKANGADIRFTSSDGTTELPREIESYSSGTLYAWVKVTLTEDSSDSSDDVIYMYYGNAAATEPAPDSTYGSERVWDGNFLAVYHLAQSPTGTIYDSTGNDVDLTSDGSMLAGDLVDGKIGEAINFDGSDDRLFSSVNITLESFTFELWVSADTWSGWRTMIAPDGAYRDFCANGGTLRVWVHPNDYVISSALSGSDWKYAVARYDDAAASNRLRGFVNGAITSQTANPSLSSITDVVRIAAWFYQGSHVDFWDGKMDEVRISSVPRSAEWIRTCYNNQNSPSTFHSVGGEVGRYVSSGTIASQVLDTGVAGARWDALFWDETLQASTDITFEVRASNTSFAKDAGTPSWTSVGGTSPVTSGLPSGRYKQWRATLSTSNTANTPTLQEVRVYHY